MIFTLKMTLTAEKMIYVASGILSAITAASLLLNVLIGLKRRNVKRELAGKSL